MTLGSDFKSLSDLPAWADNMLPSAEPGFVICPECGAYGILPERDGGIGAKPEHSPGCKFEK